MNFLKHILVIASVAIASNWALTSPNGKAPYGVAPISDTASYADSSGIADSSRVSGLADSARHAPPSAYADSSRASGLADSAKRAGWAPLDTVEVRNFIWKGISTAHLRLPLVGNGAFLKMANDGSDSVVASHFLMYDDSLLEYQYVGNTQLIPHHFRAVYNIGDASYGYAVAYGWPDGISFGKGYGIGSSPFDTLFRIPDNGPTWSKSGYRVLSGTAKGFLKADGSVDSSGVFAGVTDSARASHISDSAKVLVHYGTLAQDTAISKRVASDTATVLRTGIASAITTSEAYATARISDSLTANARAWTTLTAAKSSIHDTATALRTYIGSASTTGNAATSTKLSTARTIATSGDVTGTPTAFDGTANITIPMALPTLLTAGSAGSATTVPTLTWDAKGRLAAVGSAAISIPHTQISDWAATLGGYDMLSNTTFSVPVTGDGIITLATGPRIEGTYDIRWEANSRVEHLQIVVSTTQFGTNYLAINTYKTYGAASSFQRISIYQSSDASTKYLCLTIGNRNSGTGSIGVKYFGSYGPSNGGTYTGTEVAYLIPVLNTYQNTGAIGAPTIYENGVALSSKYLGINASIPHTQINDWSTATSSFLTANQSISLTGAVTGSGTTSIATSFANTHLAGINQDLTTTSSPTFGAASLGTWATFPAYAWFGAAEQKNTTNGNSGFLQHTGGDVFMCAPSGHMVDIQYNSTEYLRADSSGVSILQDAPLFAVTPPSTFTGLITANGGISGNLTGHASLDIPLTGSSAIAGSLSPATNQYYDFGAPSYQWNNVRAKTFVENGTSLSGLYASLNNDNALFGQNDFIGRTITDGNLLVRATFSTGFSVWSTNTARTLDIANTNVNIYSIVTSTQQTLPNGLYNGQVIFLKNTTQTSISLNGSINAGTTFIQPYSMVMLVWDDNNTRWF